MSWEFPENTTPEMRAAVVYLKRKLRHWHPDGRQDKQGRWYPADDERRDCCGTIRSPSVAYPWSVAHHCRTAEHVARLFEVDKSRMKQLTNRRQLPCLLGIDEALDIWISDDLLGRHQHD